MIADATNSAITVINGSVLSSPIGISGARWTNLSDDEIGGSIAANSGVVTITGSFGFESINVTGGHAIGGNNYNISF